MHAHLTLSEYGQFVGVRSECLTVKQNDTVKEYPLNRIKSIQIAKRGVSFSSDLVTACAKRGIKLFLLDFKNEIVASLSGTHQHAVVRVRQQQFGFIESPATAELSARIIAGKISNQRATLLYFKKYHSDHAAQIDATAAHLKTLTQRIAARQWHKAKRWRDALLGLEGQAAHLYWQCLIETALLPAEFRGRVGRHAPDVGNQALNYGYAILASYVWNALLNAGLEPYAGIFHAQRAGKPALVLDMMEEYRAWAVDRNIIKHRNVLQKEGVLSVTTRKKIIADIHKTFATKYHYRNRKMRLESILQRQIYHLAGAFCGEKHYKPYRFRW